MEGLKQEESQFTKLDEVVLERNVDRLIPLSIPEQKEQLRYYLAATYHLDKETQTKTGSLTALSVPESYDK